MRSTVLLLLGIHLAYARTHSLVYFYTAVSGTTDFPEFTVVGLVDDQQFFFFNSDIKKAEPKTEWIRQNVGKVYWDTQTETDKNAYQSFKHNLNVLKSRFNATKGVHTYQEMYGCEWNVETEATKGFKMYGYDGEDFLSLDLKEMRWISPVQQGIPTVQKWNNDKNYLNSDKHYFSTECVEWLKKYVEYGKTSLDKTVSPQVSVLQKSPSSPVTCHVTGFYPKEVSITWQKNGQDHDEDVDLGELLPNADGTFQKTSILRVTADERKNNKFNCVVEHQGKTIREILTENSVPIGIIVGVVAVLILLVVSGVVGFVVYRRKKGFKPVPQFSSDDSSNGS